MREESRRCFLGWHQLRCEGRERKGLGKKTGIRSREGQTWAFGAVEDREESYWITTSGYLSLGFMGYTYASIQLVQAPAEAKTTSRISWSPQALALGEPHFSLMPQGYYKPFLFMTAR